MSMQRFYRTPWFALCAFAVFFTVHSTVAAASCVVTLEGSSLPEWDAAVAAVNAQGTATPPEAALDCEQAVVTLLPEGMVLIFVTRDGRTAKRRLGSPEELAPTLQALSISDSTPAQPEAATAAEVAVASAEPATKQAPSAASASNSRPSAASASNSRPSAATATSRPSASPTSISGRPAPMDVRHWSTNVLSGARVGGHWLLGALVEADVGYRWSTWRLGLVVNTDIATFRLAGANGGYLGSP